MDMKTNLPLERLYRDAETRDHPFISHWEIGSGIGLFLHI